jgi:DNA ligase-1
MRFEILVQASEAVKQTRSRQRKIELLAECIGQLGPSLAVGVAYLAGELPQGRIGLGPSLVFKNPPAAARETAELEVADVDAAFGAIQQVRGAGSGAERLRLWLGLLARATPPEQQFLRHLAVGELRQGALESLVADAVARAAKISPSSIRRALMLAGSLPEIAVAAMTGGEARLAQYHIELFRPLLPMLAQTAETPEAALGSLSEGAAFEYKLDGVRVQVHKLGGDVRVYTRQLSDVTAAVPEVVDMVRALPSASLVLDGEVLSLREGGAPEPFQTTMRRFGRKLDVERMRSELPLQPFFFDVLHRDGADLIDLPAAERLSVLDQSIPSQARIPRLVTTEAAAAAEFFERAIDVGHEGLMAKSVVAPYAAGRRGQSWLKIKSHHTLDLVVLGVEWGSGRRQGWLSNLHLGARDPKGGFVMVGKTFKGLTDELLRWQTRALSELELKPDDKVGRDAYVVWVRAELVVEIAFNDVQVSPHYPGGVALRFARVRRYRPDKSPLEADTIDTVRALCPG